MGLAKMQVALVALLMVAGCAYRLQSRDSRARAIADTVVDESSRLEEVDEGAIHGAHGKPSMTPSRTSRVCSYKEINCHADETDKDMFDIEDPISKAMNPGCRGKPDRIQLCVAKTYKNGVISEIRGPFIPGQFIHRIQGGYIPAELPPTIEPVLADEMHEGDMNITISSDGGTARCVLGGEQQPDETRTKILYRNPDQSSDHPYFYKEPDLCKLRVMKCEKNCDDSYVTYDASEYLVLKSGPESREKKAEEAMVLVCEENKRFGRGRKARRVKVLSLRNAASHRRLGASGTEWIGAYWEDAPFDWTQMRLYLNSSTALEDETATTIEVGRRYSPDLSPVCVYEGSLVSSYKCSSDPQYATYQPTAIFRFMDPKKHGWFEDNCDAWTKGLYGYLKDPIKRPELL